MVDERYNELFEKSSEMTEEELNAFMQKLVDEKFYIDMIDHWRPSDYADYNHVSAQINKLSAKHPELSTKRAKGWGY